MNVLIACEESQVECIAFRSVGCRAFSCDIQKCRPKGHPEWHIHSDVTPFLHGETSFYTQDGKWHSLKKWDLIVAHPPCTYLCKVGSPWLFKKPNFTVYFRNELKIINQERYENLVKARAFFFECLGAAAPFVAVENPLPMALANLPKPSCFVQPYWYGHKYSKKTLYWLKNLPPLMPQMINPEFKDFVRASRGKYRSRTFPGIAKAMAEQWTEYIKLNIKQKTK